MWILLMLIVLGLAYLMRSGFVVSVLLSFCIYCVLPPYGYVWDIDAIGKAILLYIPIIVWLIIYYFMKRISQKIELPNDLSEGQKVFLQTGKFEIEELMTVVESLKRKGAVEIETEELNTLRSKIFSLLPFDLFSDLCVKTTVYKSNSSVQMTEDELFVYFTLFDARRLSFTLPYWGEGINKETRTRDYVLKRALNIAGIKLAKSCSPYIRGQWTGHIGLFLMECILFYGLYYAAISPCFFTPVEAVLCVLAAQYALYLSFRKCGALHASHTKYKELPELDMKWAFALSFCCAGGVIPFVEIISKDPAAAYAVLIYILILLIIPAATNAPILKEPVLRKIA